VIIALYKSTLYLTLPYLVELILLRRNNNDKKEMAMVRVGVRVTFNHGVYVLFLNK